MGIFKSIRTWFSGKGSTSQSSSSVAVNPIDPSPVTEFLSVTNEAPFTVSTPPIETVPMVSFPETTGQDVETTGVVEEERQTKRRVHRRTRARSSRTRSK